MSEFRPDGDPQEIPLLEGEYPRSGAEWGRLRGRPQTWDAPERCDELVLDKTMGVFVVRPDLARIDPDLAQAIPQHLAHRYKVIPLAQKDNRLMLGMVDPLNVIAVDDIRLITGFDINPVCLSPAGGRVPSWEELGRPTATIGPKHEFPLRGVSVQARVSGPLASVSLRQCFANPFPEPMEAIYTFPLSAGAAVYEYRMRVGERVVEGEIQEKHQARKTYAEGKTAGHRTALVEQERDNVLTMTVGNVAPGEEVTVELVYAERLETDEARTSLRIPLVVAPRYVPGRILGVNQGSGVASDTDDVPDASRISPPQLGPDADAGVSLDIQVELETGGLLPNFLSCTQHAVSQTNSEGNLVVELARHDEMLDRDFVLVFSLAQDEAQGALLTSGEHFLVLVNPPKQVPQQGTPRDVVFLIDRSGSMGGAKIISARRAALAFLERLGSQDRFALVAFDDKIEHFHAGGWSPTSRLAEAREWMETVCQARGGTAILGPLKWLLEQQQDSGRLLCAVLITDGEVGNEPQVYGELQQRLGSARIFTLGVDTAVNDAFLRQVAHLGRGTCELVTPGERLEGAVDRLSRELGTPVVTDLQLVDHGLHIEPQSLAPSRMPDLFAARPVVAVGKKRGEGDLILEGKLPDGRPWSVRLAPTVSGNPALGVLWARQRVRDLEDRLRLGKPQERTEIEACIRKIALDYGLLTRFTSFVLVDRSQVVNQGGQGRTEVQPVQLPAQWVPQAAASGVSDLLSSVYGAPDFFEVEETVKNISAADFGPLEFEDEADEEPAVDKIRDMAGEAPIVRVVKLIIAQAINDHASHIHIEPEEKSVWVRYRVDGVLHDVMNPPKFIQLPMLANIKILMKLDVAVCDRPQQGAIDLTHDGRALHLTASTLPTAWGERVVVRLCERDDALRDWRQKDTRWDAYREAAGPLQELAKLERGLVLVAGASGSGRSTLMARLMLEANGGDRACLLIDESWGQPLPSVSLAHGPVEQLLAGAARQDLDVVAASDYDFGVDLDRLVQLALGRCLVLLSWPGNDPAEVLVDLGWRAAQRPAVLSALRSVVVLRAFPCVCPNCREEETDPDVLAALGGDAGAAWVRGRGCDHCSRCAGVRGLVRLAQVVPIDHDLRVLLAGRPGPDQVRAAIGEDRIRAQALELARQGEIPAARLLSPNGASPTPSCLHRT